MDLRTSRSLLFNVKSTWPLTRVLYFHVYMRIFSHLSQFFLGSPCDESAYLTANCCNQLYIELQYGSSDFRILGLFYHMFLDLFFIIAISNLLRTGTEHEPLGCSAVINPRFRMSKSWIHFTFMMHHFNLYSCIVPSFDLICPWQCQ